MLDINVALNEFKQELNKRGHPSKLVWLHVNQMHLSNNALNIYSKNGYLSEQHVVNVYRKYEGDFECGSTLMLVATDNHISYCTFLVDSFGSDHDVELIEDSFYLWCDPYVKTVRYVTSWFKWFLLRVSGIGFKLSSLDYAFSIKQARI